MTEKMAKVFVCECGTYHKFVMYVAAHWRDILRHTCENCGAVHTIQMGYATLKKKGRKAVKK